MLTSYETVVPKIKEENGAGRLGLLSNYNHTPQIVDFLQLVAAEDVMYIYIFVKQREKSNLCRI